VVDPVPAMKIIAAATHPGNGVIPISPFHFQPILQNLSGHICAASHSLPKTLINTFLPPLFSMVLK
jgi:hypothetical protein